MKRTIEREDILSNADFLIARPTLWHTIRSLKDQRRVHVGQDITLYFENHTTLTWQIQEMLRVEQGGDEQLQDELLAYVPLIPQKLTDGSQELVATLMIEINDIDRRRHVLRELCDIENHVHLHIDTAPKITASFETDAERTTEDGKTSAVHFLRFKLSPEHIRAFCTPETEVALAIDHQRYNAKANLTATQKSALMLDFDI